MPRLFTMIIGLIMGYLDGAGLGAASFDLFPALGAEKDARIALLALAVTGPLGALFGLLLALPRSPDSRSAT